MRVLGFPFALLLGVICIGLIAAGVALLEETADDGRPDQSASLLGIEAFSRDRHEPDTSAAIAGASLVGFGVLGAIGAVALLIASLSSDRKEPVPTAPAQQQQVVVVHHPDGRVEVQERR